jgi:tripartite-type tricarboxylate transporter receptor subunit TctC
MKIVRREFLHLTAGAAALLFAPYVASAQAYPSRPVKLIVPFAPGGPNDIVARLLAQKFQEALGGTFIVENLPGGGGTIGTGNAANQPSDGHTLLVANHDIILQSVIRAKVPYGCAPKT